MYVLVLIIKYNQFKKQTEYCIPKMACGMF